MTFTLHDAIELATQAHAGVRDKGEVPYVQHVLRVAQMVAAAGYDEETQIAAVLHDTVEDVYGGSYEVLRSEGVSERSIAMIDAVTRREDASQRSGKEPYQGGLIARAAAHDDGGRAIKIMDNAHNSLPRRTDMLGPQQSDMGRKRYTPARVTLLAAEQSYRERTGAAGGFPTDPDEFMAWAIALDAHLEAALLDTA